MVYTVGWKGIMRSIFREILVSWAGAVDVAEGLRGVECDFVRANAYDGTIAGMEACDIEMGAATENGELRGEERDGPEFWTGDGGKRRAVEVIENGVEEVGEELCHGKSVGDTLYLSLH